MHVPNLTGIPETMLWTLHNRAGEALHENGIIRDPKCCEIYKALDYDFERSFGKADGSHAMRSCFFDERLREFLARHPDGVIINLGEGLETQRFRVVGDEALWFSIDLPDAIAIRERFIQPDEQHRHIGISALDTRWMDAVPNDRPIYMTAQGLLMYFTPNEVKDLVVAMAERFPCAWIAFDHIPEWLSRKTQGGWQKTPHYRTPEMPWGINFTAVEQTFRQWVPGIQAFHQTHFKMPRGIWRYLGPIFIALPFMRPIAPGISWLQFAD